MKDDIATIVEVSRKSLLIMRTIYCRALYLHYLLKIIFEESLV